MPRLASKHILKRSQARPRVKFESRAKQKRSSQGPTLFFCFFLLVVVVSTGHPRFTRYGDRTFCQQPHWTMNPGENEGGLGLICHQQ